MSVGVAFLRSLDQLWAEPHLRSLGIQVNRRLRTTIARCVASKGVIEISPSVERRTTRSQREIVCHEAAHYVVWRRYGKAARPHGAEWAALVTVAGFEARASAIRCGATSGRGGPSVSTFRHICPICQFAKRAKRRMSRWRCPECRAVGLDGVLRIKRVSAGR
jgi:predicted SprT family Zn-dependent metalloprotease